MLSEHFYTKRYVITNSIHISKTLIQFLLFIHILACIYLYVTKKQYIEYGEKYGGPDWDFDRYKRAE